MAYEPFAGEPLCQRQRTVMGRFPDLPPLQEIDHSESHTDIIALPARGGSILIDSDLLRIIVDLAKFSALPAPVYYM